MECDLYHCCDSVGDIATFAAVTSQASQSYIINKCCNSVILTEMFFFLSRTFVTSILYPTQKRSVLSFSSNVKSRCPRVVGPRLWNVLPIDIKCCRTLSAFRKALKTHIFKAYYC